MHLPDVRVLPIMTALLLAGPAIAKDDPTAPASSLPAGAKSPRASNKWRISFDESSKTDGQIIFRVWPKGSDPIEVSVVVRKGQQENSIARSARDAFKAVLGKAYGVETDDGEDVLIKVKGKTANFGLELVSSSAKDVDIDLDRE